MAEEEKIEVKTFTQEEMDKAIADRLARKDEQIAKKYGDYDELKTKVGGYEKQIADMTAAHEQEVADLNSKIQSYEADSVKTRIALETGLPYDLAMRLQGTDEESLRADAEKLANYTKPQMTAPQYIPEPPVESDPKKAALKQMLDQMKN